MIEDKLEYLDPIGYLIAAHADRFGQFFVRDRFFGR